MSVCSQHWMTSKECHESCCRRSHCEHVRVFACTCTCAHVWQAHFWSRNKTCKFWTSPIKKNKNQRTAWKVKVRYPFKSCLSYEIAVKSIFDMLRKPWTDVHSEHSVEVSVIVTNSQLQRMQTCRRWHFWRPQVCPFAQTYRCSLNLSQSTWAESALGLIWFQSKTICRQAFVWVPTSTARWD